MAMWDRVKFLLLLGILWLSGLAVVWAASVNPLGGPFSDAVRIALNDYSWILILAGIEFVRQLHYYLEEHSKGYFRFWEKKVFGERPGPRPGDRRLDPVPPRPRASSSSCCSP